MKIDNPVGLLMIVLLCLVSACSTPGARQGTGAQRGVAVVGVTARNGLDVAVNRNLAAQDFAGLLAERDQFPVLSAVRTRELLGPQLWDKVLAAYASSGELPAAEMQALIAARLPVRFVLLARLETDRTRHPPLRREAIYNQAGERVLDRERHVLATQRITEVSALLIDLDSGSVAWRRNYRVDPVAEMAKVHYLGSSFSASLAAAFANTMVNGLRVSSYPDTPPLRLSLQSLLGEIANAVPLVLH